MSDFQIALLGIGGTLLGTVLGWLLNTISQRGKLYIYPSKWDEKLKHQDSFGAYVPCEKLEDAECYSCELVAEIYNSGAETEIMRKIEFVFSKDRTEIFRVVPRDSDSRIHIAGTFRTEPIGSLNIPGKNIIKIDLEKVFYSSQNEYDALFKCNRVYLTYLDKKSRKHRKEIVTLDFEECIRKQNEKKR